MNRLIALISVTAEVSFCGGVPYESAGGPYVALFNKSNVSIASVLAGGPYVFALIGGNP